MKTRKYKLGIAYLIMFSGVLFFVLGEDIIHNKYWIERLVTGSTIFLFGARYLWILMVRLERYGRC